MARPLRIEFPGAFYHVTSRGNERKAVIKTKGDWEQFFEYLKSAAQRVELALGENPVLKRNLKMYLCQRYTGEKLKTIGYQFGIGESAVSHACRRIKAKIEQDRKMKRKIEKKLHMSSFKT